MSLIEFQNVSFSYGTDEGEERVDVIENLNLNIEKGSFTAVLGHNGSGKSTLAKLTNGILFPQQGKVLVDGSETKPDDSIFDIRKKVGMVFQNPDNQIVASIVEEDVAFGVENLGVPPQECRRRVDDAMKTVGIYEQRLKAPHKLSGGQKQRVAVAGIIAMKPECIVLDEPTAMLDPSGRAEVLETIKSSIKKMASRLCSSLIIWMRPFRQTELLLWTAAKSLWMIRRKMCLQKLMRLNPTGLMCHRQPSLCTE